MKTDRRPQTNAVTAPTQIRLVLAFLIAPVVPVIILGLCKQYSIIDNVHGFANIINAYIGTFSFGSLAFVIFQEVGWRRPTHYVGGGFIAIFVVALLMTGWDDEHIAELGSEHLQLVWLSFCWGALATSATSTFWLIAFGSRRIRGRKINSDE